MPIKIFSAPGDHRDDFKQVEEQVNTWIAESSPRVISVNPTVNNLQQKREHGNYMLTLVVHYDDRSS